MIVELVLELKVFLFIMALLNILSGIVHTVSVFRLKKGKIISSNTGLVLFFMSLSYIITMLICGF